MVYGSQMKSLGIVWSLCSLDLHVSLQNVNIPFENILDEYIEFERAIVDIHTGTSTLNLKCVWKQCLSPTFFFIVKMSFVIFIFWRTCYYKVRKSLVTCRIILLKECMVKIDFVK